MTLDAEIQEHLKFIYDSDTANSVFQQLQTRPAEFSKQYPQFSPPKSSGQRLSEADSILITYGDQISEPGKAALRSLGEFANNYLKDNISTIHILPFYPYSSDDGFSVIDYTAINPGWGSWHTLALLRQNFRLMFDAVINHASVQSAWFKGFLAGQKKYTNYFITVAPNTNLKEVIRPRTSPLLTPVKTVTGTKYVWTTFSADQADLNYKEPQLLLEIIDVLLFYVANGADFIRLDAIAFMWKEIGTPCLHLPQTHRVIQLFRTILNVVAPHVLLVTETNVPHAENLSYFGDGRNEAQMVYQFALAPLILHTFYTGYATKLQQWAAGLEPLPETATFFNFIASHDGVGVRPAEGILTPDEIQHLADKTVQHGGYVSYKTNPDGSQSAYELNITLFDALSKADGNEPIALKIDRFIASQAIMLALVGVPGIYIHSLFGSSNNYIGVEETGRVRSVNRQKWHIAEIETVMADPNARANKIFQRYSALLKARAAHRAFHPNGKQQVITGNPSLFVVLRVSPDEQDRVLCIHNISAQTQQVKVDAAELSMGKDLYDILSGAVVDTEKSQMGQLTVAPYEIRWIAG